MQWQWGIDAGGGATAVPAMMDAFQLPCPQNLEKYLISMLNPNYAKIILAISIFK